jgi:AhpD family alkylhydroperoxidase
VADLLGAFAARPELARTLAAHVRELSNGVVPQRTKELIALMVGWLNACEYCTCVHEEIARGLGVDQATLTELGDFATSERFSDAERAALQATVALTREPRALPVPVWDALRASYDEAACVEVLAAIGLNNYLSRMSNALSLRAPSRARP